MASFFGAKAAIEQLANRYSFIDINRVGIHGHSGGGYMSTGSFSILQYPDFFKAAVSCAFEEVGILQYSSA